MVDKTLGRLAPEHREPARAALIDAFGTAAIEDLTPVLGGASGASLLRVAVRGGRYLLRVEGPETSLLRRNLHRYACTRLAAEAGVAPVIRHLDAANGVMVTDFIEQQPLSAFPGGPPALAQALGALLGRLQAGPRFPRLVYYPDLLTRMLEQVRGAGLFSPGLLDAHVERLASVRARLDWDATPLAPSHNDPNPNNILFDGERLWLIDWESAYANDPLVDVAIVLDGLAAAPGLEDALLTAWLGRAPDPPLRDRLALVRSITRLYYACFLLHAGAAGGSATPEGDLSTLSAAGFREQVRNGTLPPGTPEHAHQLGKLFLRAFFTGEPAPEL